MNTHNYTHTHTHTYIHTYIHTYTHKVCTFSNLLERSRYRDIMCSIALTLSPPCTPPHHTHHNHMCHIPTTPYTAFSVYVCGYVHCYKLKHTTLYHTLTRLFTFSATVRFSTPQCAMATRAFNARVTKGAKPHIQTHTHTYVHCGVRKVAKSNGQTRAYVHTDTSTRVYTHTVSRIVQ